jgi:phosphatidylglycerol phospholipase C
LLFCNGKVLNQPILVLSQIDVKANNDPERLFTLMRAILSAHENWETTIAPRLILGLWHPKFVGHAVEILPNIKRCFIGMDLTLAQYPIFWNACDAFSISFPALATADGELFRQRCKSDGKDIFTWTCNRQEEWALAAAWNLDVVMTDTPSHYLAERKAVTGASRLRYSRCSDIFPPSPPR